MRRSVERRRRSTDIHRLRAMRSEGIHAVRARLHRTHIRGVVRGYTRLRPWTSRAASSRRAKATRARRARERQCSIRLPPETTSRGYCGGPARAVTQSGRSGVPFGGRAAMPLGGIGSCHPVARASRKDRRSRPRVEPSAPGCWGLSGRAGEGRLLVTTDGASFSFVNPGAYEFVTDQHALRQGTVIVPTALSPGTVERFESCVAHLEPSAFIDDAQYCYECGARLGVYVRVTSSLEVVTDSYWISSYRRRLGLVASVPSVVTLSLDRQVWACSGGPPSLVFTEIAPCPAVAVGPRKTRGARSARRAHVTRLQVRRG